VIVASHDRTFLDRVCTHLIDLDPAALGTDGAGGSRFRGSFSDYLRVRASARARWEQEHQRQQDEIAALRAASKVRHRDVAPGRGPRDNDKFVHAFKGARVDRTVARRAKAAERRLEQAERVALSKPPTVLRLTADLPGYAGGVVAARELVVRGRLRVPVLHVEPGGRLLVTGANGTGKSTLLAVLAGRLAPDEGHVHVSGRSALLTQDTHFADPDRVAAQVYAEAVGPARAAAVPLRSLGLLAATAHGTPVGLLSTGQQRRLSLAIVMAQSPDVLLLDEPSNHLSPTLVTELEDALATTGSTVVVATHDRWLRQRWHGPELHLTRDDAPAQRRPPDVPAARRHAERRGDADERLSPVCAR
jgi:macrolide transport system ATP-binding/permease protein